MLNFNFEGKLNVNSILNFLKKIKWYDYLFLAVCYAVVIAVGIIFQSTWLVVLCALFGTLSVFFIAKGFVIANVFGIVQVVLYSIISFMNAFYGEVVVCVLNFVISLAALISWFKNRDGDKTTVKIAKSFGWKKWLLLAGLSCVVFVAFFFILREFDTANLIVSTLSVTGNFAAGFLIINRSELNFIFYVLNNVMCIVLWTIIVLNGGLSYLPTLINYVIFIVINIIGVVNWVKMKKQQNLIVKSED